MLCPPSGDHHDNFRRDGASSAISSIDSGSDGEEDCPISSPRRAEKSAEAPRMQLFRGFRKNRTLPPLGNVSTDDEAGSSPKAVHGREPERQISDGTDGSVEDIKPKGSKLGLFRGAVTSLVSARKASRAATGGAPAKDQRVENESKNASALGGTVAEILARVQANSSKRKPGVEWQSKLQADEDVRHKAREAITQIMKQLEAAGFQVEMLNSKEKLKLTERINSEIDTVMQVLAKQAFTLVINDWEELDTLRKVIAELDNKVAVMNHTYLKEITANRDRNRMFVDGAMELVRTTDCAVSFYEPMQYLSAEVRSIVIAIIQEKLKAIFEADAQKRHQTNVAEMIRFEELKGKEQLAASESANVKLREENRQFRTKLSKIEKSMEKGDWDLSEARIENKRLQAEVDELTLLKEKIMARGRNTCDASTQWYAKTVRTLERDEEAVADDDIEVSSASKASVSSAARAASKLEGTCSVAVQTDNLPAEVPQPETRESRKEKIRQKMEKDMEKEAVDKEAEALERELQDLMSKTKPSAEPTPQQTTEACPKRELGSRGRRNSLALGLQNEAMDLEVGMDVEARVQKALRAAEQLMTKRKSEARSEVAAARAETEATQIDLRAASEQAEVEKDRADRSAQEVEVLQHQTRTLREKVESMKRNMATMQERLWEATNAGDNEYARSLSEDLAKEVKEKQTLAERLEDVEGELSIALSRNSALELVAYGDSNASGDPGGTAGGLLVSSAKGSRSGTRDDKLRAKEARETEILTSQKGQLTEKVSVQKAQLESVVQENTKLHLALKEMQAEVRMLTKQLRQFLPDIEVMGADLEAVLAKIERTAKAGGGAHLRLHKDHELREIAKAARHGNEGGDSRKMTKSSSSAQIQMAVIEPHRNLATPDSGDAGDALRRQISTDTAREDSHERVHPAPPEKAVQQLKPSPSSRTLSTAESARVTSHNIDQELPDFKSALILPSTLSGPRSLQSLPHLARPKASPRSDLSPRRVPVDASRQADQAKTAPARTNAGHYDDRKSLVLGGKRGSAIQGGNPPRLGR